MSFQYSNNVPPLSDQRRPQALLQNQLTQAVPSNQNREAARSPLPLMHGLVNGDNNYRRESNTDFTVPERQSNTESGPMFGNAHESAFNGYTPSYAQMRNPVRPAPYTPNHTQTRNPTPSTPTVREDTSGQVSGLSLGHQSHHDTNNSGPHLTTRYTDSPMPSNPSHLPGRGQTAPFTRSPSLQVPMPFNDEHVDSHLDPGTSRSLSNIPFYGSGAPSGDDRGGIDSQFGLFGTGKHRDDSVSSFSNQEKESLRRFAEKTGKVNELKVEQVQRLKRHIEYNTDGNVGNVKSSIAIHSTLFEMVNTFDTQRVDYQAISELVVNANRNANNNIVVGNNVRKMIQVLSKDRVISPSITSYTTLTHQLFDHVKENAMQFECEDLLAKPLGGKAIRAACNDAAKSALQQLRIALVSSVWGEPANNKRRTAKEPTTLEVFTYTAMDKWRDGRVGSSSGKDYQMRFAMIRVWLLKLGKEAAMSTSDVDENDKDNGDDDDTDPSTSLQVAEEPPSKKQRSDKRGRTARKKAFWSLFTDELTKRVNMWGKDLRKEEWKRYLADCVRQDWKTYGQGQQGLLAALTLEPVPDSYPPSAFPAMSAPVPTSRMSSPEEDFGDDEP
ncbi:hypothetical protein EV360DRAFT_84320 [Lentinula raphanica]|nr:hypothetical protein EV360DRAFT_84320 [Lentinula raphanica]